MELTKKERLSFINQLRILEALYPDDADTYAKQRTALEEGYALHYGWMFENLYDELSSEQCREVLDILDMYRAVTFSLQKLPEGDELKKHHRSTFSGFDGNNETHLMSYARYYIVDLDRYSELRPEGYISFNSHMPMLHTYQSMLERWGSMPNKFNLSRDELAAVLG